MECSKQNNYTILRNVELAIVLLWEVCWAEKIRLTPIISASNMQQLRWKKLGYLLPRQGYYCVYNSLPTIEYSSFNNNNNNNRSIYFYMRIFGKMIILAGVWNLRLVIIIELYNISWRILVLSFRGGFFFLKIILFLHGEIFEFP